MNRRQILMGLGAVATTPVLPNTAFAKAMPAVSGAALEHFKLAKLIARAHNRCSPQMLMRHLKCDAAMAGEVETLLLNRGVISIPGIDGVSRAINPINTNCLPQEGARAANKLAHQAKIKEGLQERTPAEKSNAPKAISDDEEEDAAICEEQLAAENPAQPEQTEDKAEDPVPASHTDPE